MSYNSDDQEVVSEYAKIIDRYAIPVWYDKGIDVIHLQCIESYKFNSILECVEKISEVLGYSINKTTMINKLKMNFNMLNNEEKLVIANNYIQSIISTNELFIRAKLLLILLILELCIMMA